MKRVPKYFPGGLIAAQGVSVLTNVLGAIGANKQAKKAASQARHDNLLNIKQTDLNALEEYPEEGNYLNSYYAMGGGIKMPSYSAKGGDLDRLSSDMELVNGRTHAQGGVKLHNGTEIIAEVEDDETIKDGTKVYSDTLEVEPGVTYADRAKKLATEKGKIEAGLVSGDSISRGTAKRKMDILDNKEDELFNQQEASKMEKGGILDYKLGGGIVPKYFPGGKLYAGGNDYGITDNAVAGAGGSGGGFGSALQQGIPYLDNIVNAALTLGTPKIQKPTYIRPAKLDTNYNVNDQLNEVRSGEQSAIQGISNNTNNAGTLRNTITGVRLRGAQGRAGIMARKENIETNLRNRNALNAQQVAAANAAKTDNYNAQQTARQGAIQSRISANFANLADDVIEKRNFDESVRYNDEMLAAIKAMYNANGVVDRSDLTMLEILKALKNKKQ